jgi:1-pyrroline-5-carboxylate dehydrogenase
MSKAISQVPLAVNEPVNSYVPGSPEVKSLIDTYKKMWAEKVEIPMIINGKEVKTDKKYSFSLLRIMLTISDFTTRVVCSM